MKWFKSSFQHNLIGALLVSILLLITFVSYSIIAFTHKIDAFEQLISQNITYERQIASLNFNFKMQVQEWKNVLIRGHNVNQLKTYWEKFRVKHNEVQKTAIKLVPLVESQKIKQQLQDFTQMHQTLLTKYQAGYDAFISNEYSHTAADEVVKGIDREPSALLLQISKAYSRDLQNSIHLAERESQRIAFWSKTVLWSMGIVILTILYLLARKY